MLSSPLVRLLLLLVPLLSGTSTAASRPLLETRNHLVFYGDWDDAKIADFRRFDLLVLQPRRYVGSRGEAQAIADIRATGTRVFLYRSLGEDTRTFGGAAPVAGDGQGPSFWDDRLGRIVREHRGIASYYLDQWNRHGPGSGLPNLSPDGFPDRHGAFGSVYVDPGHADWREVVLEDCRSIDSLGPDGFFLDAPEVADPWHWFGWTAKGLHDLIAAIDSAFPERLLFLNRGLFLFDPNNPWQYAWNPREHIDVALFESWLLDNAYPVETGGNGEYHVNPFHELNTYAVSPKVDAEAGRKDHPILVLSIDYAADPAGFPSRFADLYRQSVRENAEERGRAHLLAPRLLDRISTAVLDHPPSPDAAPPSWQNTTVGYKGIETPPFPFYMVRGWEYQGADFRAAPPAPRIGLQKAVPGNGRVALRWDAASDQTRPVRFNVYYSSSRPFRFETAQVLADVAATRPAEYADRGFTNADDACPYEFTVTGLANNTAWSFAVRAEDATRGATPPAGARIGPGGGLEETNEVVLQAIPRNTTVHPIVLDGSFTDWAGLATIEDAAGDGTPDLRRLRITDNATYLYLWIQASSSLPLSSVRAWFDSDRRSFTGDTSRRGADYKLEAGRLWAWRGAWVQLGATVAARAAGNAVEIRIPRSAIGARTTGGVNIVVESAADRLPDLGSLSHAWVRKVAETTPPSFEDGTPTAEDAGQDGIVRLAWPAATDASPPVTYAILDASGTVYSDSAGKRYEGLRETSAWVADLPNGIPATFVVEARDALGNASRTGTLSATPSLDQIPPTWEDEPGALRAVAGDGFATIYFDAAADTRHPPATFDIHVSTTDDPFAGRVLEDARIQPSDDPTHAWMARISPLANGIRHAFAVRAADRIGNRDGNRVVVHATPQGAPRLSAATMDGAFTDWAADSTVHLGASDPTGDQPSGEAEKDLTDAWLAFRDSTLFLCFRVDAPITQWDWRYAVLLDIDDDETTGAPSTGLGAELMILGPGWTYRLDGSWNAAWLGQAPHALGQDARYVEMALPASLVGPWGPTMRVLIQFGDTRLGYDIAPTFEYSPDVDRHRPYPPGL